MSEFDKEAEREKLREKFARDERKRKQTQRMSELLLKGATMTNRHCDRCGDPIFRYDDQEFCPTCAGQDAEGAAAVPDRDTEVETAEKSLDSARKAAAQGSSAPASDGTAESPTTGTDGQTEAETPADAPKQPARTPPVQQQSSTATAAGSTPASRGGEDGRADLQRALSTTASNAAAASDPHTAKAWLEAAREAAEALSALDR